MRPLNRLTEGCPKELGWSVAGPGPRRLPLCGRLEGQASPSSIGQKAGAAAARRTAISRRSRSSAFLGSSEKGRAENLMIVDLLRNDIGRIAELGSVRVPELFAIESYATVHQMVSRVTGRLIGRPGLSGLLPALFPCGSVTGAPKIRAMEIIAELEPFPRGLYCGAMGWMAPDGRAAFNVAIRTLRLFPGGELRLDVGGGIVQDSTAPGEWEEALWKTRFAELPTTPTCG